ncbi:DNA-binding protein (plasmid) [Cupriavidus necator H16]|uniref:DNA-binding protein n=1 Tax=Cupriavidus necator (strain ATCC 17699 / DSM 428 / KCTC 22496 / NCIMB 10442 / H16 / Stanier 337) TaxID=381666 RepID=Q7WXI1_CUPNH|nr:conserved hypothetical protein [Cupriavidus necator H16]
MSWDGQGEMPDWLRRAVNAGQSVEFFLGRELQPALQLKESDFWLRPLPRNGDTICWENEESHHYIWYKCEMCGLCLGLTLSADFTRVPP